MAYGGRVAVLGDPDRRSVIYSVHRLSRPEDGGSSALPGQLAVKDAACSEVGRVRASNEDAFVRRPRAGLWAVADGMGGHADGAWAASAVASALTDIPITGDVETDRAEVGAAIHRANGLIHARAQAQSLRMGSTVVALLLSGSRFTIFWAGDSRAYRLRAGRLVQLTRDHTHVQGKLTRSELTADEARSHPMAHVLTHAVGAQAVLDLDCVHGGVEAGDSLLLCSDGLHGVVGDREIAQALASNAPAEACEALMALSYARGAPDNITLVAIDCSLDRGSATKPAT